MYVRTDKLAQQAGLAVWPMEGHVSVFNLFFSNYDAVLSVTNSMFLTHCSNW